jgi:hypothetical protein
MGIKLGIKYAERSMLRFHLRRILFFARYTERMSCARMTRSNFLTPNQEEDFIACFV